MESKDLLEQAGEPLKTKLRAKQTVTKGRIGDKNESHFANRRRMQRIY